MLTQSEAARKLDFDASEITQIQDAIDTLSPETKEKFLNMFAVMGAVGTKVEIDAWSEDRNRQILATRRFLAQADRRGYIHKDDRYDPLRDKIVETAAHRLGVEDPEEAPSAHRILLSFGTLVHSLLYR